MEEVTLIQKLEERLDDIDKSLDSNAYWQEFTSNKISSELRLETMKWVMLEISSYQAEVNRAVFTAIGRLGSKIEEQGLIRAMIAVQIEEVGHGTVALNDYYKLGGKKLPSDNMPSPPALALIAVVRHLGENYHPLCHLGFMYFFEKFTTIITEKIMPYLKEAGYPNDSLEFMRLHAEEDIRHADMLANVIEESVENFENAEEYILYGFDCFSEVYPHNLWIHALEKAKNDNNATVSFN